MVGAVLGSCHAGLGHDDWCARSTAARMAAAATAMGDAAEARFWRGLPATLAALRARLPVRAAYPHPHPDLAAGVAAAFGGAASRSGSGAGLWPRAGSADSQGTDPGTRARATGEAPFATRAHIPGDLRRAALPVAPAAARKGSGGGEGALEAAAGGTGALWGEAAELAEARERVAWHEAMGRGSGPSAEHLQARACRGCITRAHAQSSSLSLSGLQPGFSLHSHVIQQAPSGDLCVVVRKASVWFSSCGTCAQRKQMSDQELRVIEYVVLGDYETAVGHLLASTPEKSARYYRDALCTLALAVRPRPDRPLRVWIECTSGSLLARVAVMLQYLANSVVWHRLCLRTHPDGGPELMLRQLHRVPANRHLALRPPEEILVMCARACAATDSKNRRWSDKGRHPQAASAEAPEAVPAGGHQQVSRTLHIQAAKVVAAHAATIGDALLAVPLLCSAGAPGRGSRACRCLAAIARALTMR